MRFLVRTKENRISGPFEKDELAERVAKGELRELDEICESNGYWIYLHERAESKRMLGVELPRKKAKDDLHEEQTETETETVTATAPLITKDLPLGGGSVQLPRATTPVPTSVAPPSALQRRPETVGLFKYFLLAMAAVIAFVLFRVFEIAQEL
jgi:hypothetical protein